MYTGQSSPSPCMQTEVGLVNSHIKGDCLFIQTIVRLFKSNFEGDCLFTQTKVDLVNSYLRRLSVYTGRISASYCIQANIGLFNSYI